MGFKFETFCGINLVLMRNLTAGFASPTDLGRVFISIWRGLFHMDMVSLNS